MAVFSRRPYLKPRATTNDVIDSPRTSACLSMLHVNATHTPNCASAPAWAPTRATLVISKSRLKMAVFSGRRADLRRAQRHHSRCRSMVQHCSMPELAPRQRNTHRTVRLHPHSSPLVLQDSWSHVSYIAVLLAVGSGSFNEKDTPLAPIKPRVAGQSCTHCHLHITRIPRELELELNSNSD